MSGLSMKTNMLWNSVGSIIRLGCNWLITVFVVRLSSGFDAAGALSLAMTVSSMVMPFAEFRLRTVQVTDVHGERSSGEYIGLRVLTTFLSFAVGAIYALVTCATGVLPVVFLYLVFQLIANFIEGFHAIDQRNMRMDYIGRSYIMQGVGNLGFFCLVLGFTNSLELAVIAMCASTLAILVFYDIPRARQFEMVKPVIEWKRAAKTLLQLLPLVFAQVCSTAVVAVPKQYLAASLGQAALGIYSSVAAPTVIVQMGATYIYSPLIGVFAEKFADDKKSALKLLAKTSLGIVAVGLVCSIGFFFFGEPILALLFGNGIEEYTYLLQPAILCAFVTAFAWFMNDLLLAVRDFKASFAGNMIASLVTLVSSAAFIQLFGMNGVSFVGAFAYDVGVLSLGIFLARDYRKL